MKQLLTFLFFGTIILLSYLQKETMLSVIESGSYIAIPVAILFVALLVFFPVVPFAMLAGIIGAIFGIWKGLGISMLGIGIGTIIMFSMARFGFHTWIQKYIMKIPRIREYEQYFEKNAFMGILIVRLFPFVPSPAVNILCGISNVSWTTFLGASLLGKLPAVFIFTFAGSVFESNNLISMSIYVLYFILIAIIVNKIIKNKREPEEMRGAGTSELR
ncbi:TVP38/TMEM64 family protein [Peribacillus alkalitolerans]|uniref:TVP38/TMEM64 family protein n=1 Tax=Peribacillus alkalitolerans TaxID=1550385 RepID=UPI0013D12453|nr:TVP38/TMEM64 family protein [Peribacillus alkalitolerans]